ncbi:MAG: PilZ domain-containing protein [Myxococcota bacterium]
MSKRRAPRITAAIGTIIRQGDQKEPCLTKTVSRTGLAVSSKKAWDPSQPLNVSIIEDGYRLTTDARLVHQKGGTLSLEFDATNPDVEPVMAGLVEALLARTGAPPEDVDLSDLENLEGVVKWTAPDRKSNMFSKRFSEGKLGDVTHEGASIITRRPPEEGTTLVLVFEHDPERDHILKTSATVVRHTDGGFAVEFDTPSREVRSWITKLRSYRRLED